MLSRASSTPPISVKYIKIRLDQRRRWAVDEWLTQRDNGIVVAGIVAVGPILGRFDGVFILLTKVTTA